MKYFCKCILFFTICLPLTGIAHHSFEMFDRGNPINISGEVREFQWVNPHTWIQLLVTDEQTGEVIEWEHRRSQSKCTCTSRLDTK